MSDKYYSYIENKMINSYYDDNNNGDNDNSIFKKIILFIFVISVSSFVVFNPFSKNNIKGFVKECVNDVTICHDTVQDIISKCKDNNFSYSYKQELLQKRAEINSLNFDKFHSDDFDYIINEFNQYRNYVISSIDLFVNSFSYTYELSSGLTSNISNINLLNEQIKQDIKTLLESYGYTVVFKDNQIIYNKTR